MRFNKEETASSIIFLKYFYLLNKTTALKRFCKTQRKLHFLNMNYAIM